MGCERLSDNSFYPQNVAVYLLKKNITLKIYWILSIRSGFKIPRVEKTSNEYNYYYYIRTKLSVFNSVNYSVCKLL